MSDLFGEPTIASEPRRNQAADIRHSLYLHMQEGQWCKVSDLMQKFMVDRAVVNRALDMIYRDLRGTYVEWRKKREEVRLVFAENSFKEDLHGV